MKANSYNIKVPNGFRAACSELIGKIEGHGSFVSVTFSYAHGHPVEESSFFYSVALAAANAAQCISMKSPDPS